MFGIEPAGCKKERYGVQIDLFFQKQVSKYLPVLAVLAVNTLILPLVIQSAVALQKWPTLSQRNRALIWLYSMFMLLNTVLLPSVAFFFNLSEHADGERRGPVSI